ncbi:MAG: FkbM family methyltransferase [Pseudomonadota bacterium]
MSALLETEIYELVDARHGRFLANPHDAYIGKSIITYGEFSEGEWQLFANILQPGMVVIEAGANMGAHTVPLAKHLGLSGLVYAFEPQLAIFQQLCANLALNDLLNVVAFNAGAGAQADWLSIVRPHPARDNNFGGFSLEKLAGEAPYIRVRIERLDEAVDPPRLDLLKADVEGMEVEVLKGAAGLIQQYRPLLYLEANFDDAPALIQHVFDLDYEAWWHIPPLYDPKNFNGVTQDIFGNITSKNILCAPRERKRKIEGGRAVTGPDDHPRHWG